MVSVQVQLRKSLFNSQILSQFDVYAVVGGNRPLQVRDIRVTVEMNGAIMVNFRGVRGSPMVCGICIRKAPLLTGKELILFNLLIFREINFVLHLWQQTQLQMGMSCAKTVQQILISQTPRLELQHTVTISCVM